LEKIIRIIIPALLCFSIVILTGCASLNFKQEYDKGIKAYNEKNYDLAITYFNNALSHKHDSYSALCLLGTSYAYKKDYKLAEKTLQDAIKIYPKEWNAYILLGDVKKRQKNVQKAIDYYETAITLETMGGTEKLYYKNYINNLKQDYVTFLNKDPLVENQSKEKLKNEIINAYSKEKKQNTQQIGEVILSLDKKLWEKVNEQKDEKSKITQYGLKGEDIKNFLWTKIITVQYFVQNDNFKTTLNDYYNLHINAIANSAKNTNKAFVKKIISQTNSEILYEWNFDNGKETEIARIIYTKQGIYHIHIAKKGIFTAEEKAEYTKLIKEALLR